VWGGVLSLAAVKKSRDWKKKESKKSNPGSRLAVSPAHAHFRSSKQQVQIEMCKKGIHAEPAFPSVPPRINAWY